MSTRTTFATGRRNRSGLDVQLVEPARPRSPADLGHVDAEGRGRLHEVTVVPTMGFQVIGVCSACDWFVQMGELEDARMLGRSHERSSK